MFRNICSFRDSFRFIFPRKGAKKAVAQAAVKAKVAEVKLKEMEAVKVAVKAMEVIK